MNRDFDEMAKLRESLRALLAEEVKISDVGMLSDAANEALLEARRATNEAHVKYLKFHRIWRDSLEETGAKTPGRHVEQGG